MGNVKRCDLRLPEDLYLAIKELAKANGAKKHHRSGEIIIGPTIISLIEKGLGQVSDKISDNLSDKSVIDSKIEAAISPLIADLSDIKKHLELSDKLPDKVSDNLSDNLSDKQSDKVTDNLSDKFSDGLSQKELAARLGVQPQSIRSQFKKLSPEKFRVWMMEKDPNGFFWVKDWNERSSRFYLQND